MSWQQGTAAPCAVRVVGRWSPVATVHGAGLGCRLGRCWALPTGEQHPSRQARQVRPVISAMLWRSRPPFPCFIALFLTRLHPSPIAATPSSTQNAPGFALLRGWIGGGFPFFAVLGRKILGMVFVTWLVALPAFWGKRKAGRVPGLSCTGMKFYSASFWSNLIKMLAACVWVVTPPGFWG